MPSQPASPEPFPPDFLFGAATAAFQVEGSTEADGRGESIWDRLCRRPGHIKGADDGAEACDHYRRWPEDIRLMRGMGLEAYRFSIAWPRVIPAGTGAVNAKGLDFYDRLVDGLLAAGIKPFATLYHWDLPQPLEDAGGWPSRVVPDAFTAYAEAVVRRLGDRVDRWMTLNEIPVFTSHGYGNGLHAPGKILARKEQNLAVHHALLAHGRAVEAVRRFAKPGAQVGLVNNPLIGVPALETEAHAEAARKAVVRFNGYMLEPLCHGAYAPWWLEEQGADAPEVAEGDLAAIAAPCDFMGLNIYSGVFVEPSASPAGFRELPFPKGYPKLEMNWLKPMPQVIYWGCRMMREVYGARDLYVTENGCACVDERVEVDGETRVMDSDRVQWLRDHFAAAKRAVDEGLPLKGFFVWSLLDNFEWQEGYSKRFGLLHVDYRTQRRTWKDSARWYKIVIQGRKIV